MYHSLGGTEAMDHLNRRGKRLSELDARIEHLRNLSRLDSWNNFVSELQVPSYLMPGIITMRPELLLAAAPGPLGPEEVKVLLRVMGGLMETNAALRQHAELLAGLTDDALGMLKGLNGTLGKIGDYAHFRSAGGSGG